MPSVTVLGAGPGGYAAAFYAADLGMQVALVDEEPNPGGVWLFQYGTYNYQNMQPADEAGDCGGDTDATQATSASSPRSPRCSPTSSPT